MINQASKGLNSRSEIVLNTLPLITAPMSAVVNSNNYKVFKNLGIEPIIPRTSKLPDTYDGWYAVSLDEFIKIYNEPDNKFKFKDKVLIDVANGNMPKLHKAIKYAKSLYGNDLIIMAGNVGSVDAFMELAKTGVDYIRVGIGGGGGCHTTRNTGVGQECLETLISDCVKAVVKHNSIYQHLGGIGNPYVGESMKLFKKYQEEQYSNIIFPKIIADGISSYIKQCETKHNFNDNGYAAIIKLLYAGADLVMIGRLFAQSKESAGEKREFSLGYPKSVKLNNVIIEDTQKEVLYSGMSTQKEQKGYSNQLKPSEGSTTWLPVRWTLNEWLYGREDQDQYPFINGFVNSLKSAMSYAGANTLIKFKK